MKAPLEGEQILLLEDEPLLRKRLAAFLEQRGADVIQAGSLEEARNVISGMSLDYALCDINLPDGESLDLLREGAFNEATQIVIMTAQGGVETAVEAMRLGAGDYLAKPFEPAEALLAFRRCRESSRSDRREQHQRQAQATGDESFFFGDAMAELRGQLERIIATDNRLLGKKLPPVLIEGETGTGKTTIARWLHRNGPLAERAMVDVNCSTLPDLVAESELFGHERGAFTDAKTARIGLFEAADGGTLFLDEIASLSMQVQAKVLKAIEDGIIRRLGGNKEIAVNVRLIAASNRPMQQMVAEGVFREDLYHRLDLLRIKLPPLRERAADIPRLATHLLNSLGKRYGIRDATITANGARRLMACQWPGNVRELAHELERALIFAEDGKLDFGTLQTPLQQTTANDEASTSLNTNDSGAQDWLNPQWQFPEEGFSLEASINRFIQKALDQCNGNVSAAARLLGVTRDYIRYRVKK